MDGAEIMERNTGGFSERELLKLKQSQAREHYGVALDDKSLSARVDERQQQAAIRVIFTDYDIIRVRSMNSYYYKNKADEGYTYRRADDGDRDFKNLVKQAYRMIGVPVTGKKINSTVDTLKEEVDEEVETIDTNIIEIVDGWYWDGHESKITQEPSNICFLRLFDNTGQSSPSTIEVDKEAIMPEYIKGMYKANLKWLNLLDGNLPTPEEIEGAEEGDDLKLVSTFDFIYTWACGRADVYNDMLKAAASIFMKNKPMGAFILTGLKRNGKSTFVKMLHTLLGRANTSALRLADLSSRHRTLTLMTSLMNAPDEETEGKDMDEEATANFKSMSAHEPVLLPVMYSPKPQWISTNFTMFCPMNTDPEWKGNSASACNQRSLIIPFNADLSQFDNSGKDFARETFTAYMYNNLLAALFAIATYYNGKKMEFGETMKQAKKVVEADTDNRIEYAKLFNKWFVGYALAKDVWVDYVGWCKRYGYRWVKQKELMFAIHNIGGGASRTNITKPYSDTPISVVRLGNKKGNNFFILDETLPELKSTIDKVLYHTNNLGDKTATDNSVVQGLEQWYEQQSLNQVRAKAAAEELEDGE